MARSRSRAGKSGTVRAAWRASSGGLSAVVVFSAFINLLKFAMPLYLLQVLDRIPASRSIETLIMLTIITLLAISSGLALEVVRRRMMARWGGWIEHEFGPKLLHRSLMDSSFGQPSKAPQALADLGRLRSFVAGSAASWFDVIWAPVFFIGVYLIHPLLGAVAFSAVIVLVLLGVLQEAMTREPRRASRDASNNADDIVLAAERNMESVGALTMAGSLTERWRRSTVDRLEERERFDTRSAVFTSLLKGAGQFVRIGIIAVGIWLFLQNALTLGGIFAARVMTGFGTGLVERAVRNWRALRNAGSAYRSVKAQLADDDTIAPSVHTGTEQAALVVDRLSFRHPGQRDSLYRDLSLTLEPGEVLLVTGAAATGKSTLSRLLVGLLEPRHGQVRLGDVDVARLPGEMRSRLIGYLPQHTELFKGTVRENIARMADGPLDDVVAAAKLVDIHDLIVRMPQGYDTEISGDTVGLSGSEFKRIALARAFYGRPRLVVLDEPAASLDRPSRRMLEAAVAKLKEQGSSIILTQVIETTRTSRLADKFLILGGRSPELSVADPQSKTSAERNRNQGLRSVK